MTSLLLSAERCGMILWLTPMPFEIAFDATEAGMDREMVVNG
ncbi:MULTISPECIES: hypothetical protein [Bradyrhizobium]|uniref:Uncharacterized protein n=1 Tax=Bradyrhizobium septentrionale TaxID=1404411 RepID=A0ABZ2NX49_9BRAD|nr:MULTISPECIES: hypothetical protein [Bradyrhizobium]